MLDSNVMTCTQALAELKLVDKRIEKKINNSTFVSFEGEFRKRNVNVNNATSDYQSINDLIKRRTKIKAALIASNAITRVSINGEEMSVAEAIETKSTIKHKKRLLQELKSQYGSINNEIERENAKHRRNIEDRYSKPTDDKKEDNNFTEISKKYMELNGVKIVDPIEIDTKIKELEAYIEGFETQVDYVLSVKNATTEIKI